MANHLPSPPVRQGTTEVSLLTSADPLPADVAGYNRWRTGLTWRSTVDITAESQPNDCTTFSWAAPTDPTLPVVDTFTIGVVHGCDGRVDADEFADEGRAALEDKQAWLVGREVWTGADHPQSLQATATLVSGTASVRRTIADLVANYQDATKGGRAVVHVPYRALESAAASLLDVVTRVGNRLVMADGTIVVPGPGYPGNAGNWGPLTDDNDPESGAAASSGEVFIYVTGPVQVGLGPVADRSSDRPRANQVQALFERQVIARWDPTFVFAGKATL